MSTANSKSRAGDERESVDLAYDPDLEWLHCNKCTSFDHGSSTFYLSQCGHIICQSCLDTNQQRHGSSTSSNNRPGAAAKINAPNVHDQPDDDAALLEATCPVCGKLCALVVVGAENTSPEVERLFLPTARSLDEIAKIHKLQYGNAIKLIRALKAKVFKQTTLLEQVKPTLDQTRKKLQAKEAELLDLQHTMILLRAENEGLKEGRHPHQNGGDHRHPPADQILHHQQQQQYQQEQQQPQRLQSTSPRSGSGGSKTPNPPARISLRPPSRTDHIPPPNGYTAHTHQQLHHQQHPNPYPPPPPQPQPPHNQHYNQQPQNHPQYPRQPQQQYYQPEQPVMHTSLPPVAHYSPQPQSVTRQHLQRPQVVQEDYFDQQIEDEIMYYEDPNLMPAPPRSRAFLNNPSNNDGVSGIQRQPSSVNLPWNSVAARPSSATIMPPPPAPSRGALYANNLNYPLNNHSNTSRSNLVMRSESRRRGMASVGMPNTGAASHQQMMNPPVSRNGNMARVNTAASMSRPNTTTSSGPSSVQRQSYNRVPVQRDRSIFQR
ncbi:hypothetical protein SeMB42_g04725 [Synchytrium endobioticum]|uniref:RING-type domain-containing protein n=1 Tax=Synchytrium endobioticum TaxID=286115 RepID=A0A507CWI7_9FUNG|nr:hypothetical protein SeMB42_g04725 [Synchytrium endobioticum]